MPKISESRPWAVRRSDYDMDDWQMALSDRVVFVLRARLKPAAAP